MKEENMTHNIAVIGAMKEEVVAYRAAGWRYAWDGLSVSVYEGGVGVENTAIVTRDIINRTRPKLMIFTGLAGALDRELEVGDLCLGIAAINADMDVRAWDKTYARGQIPFSKKRVFLGNERWGKEAMRLSGGILREAYIATGSAFLDKPGKDAFCDRLEELAWEHNGVTRVPQLYDMETSAFLHACQNQTSAIVLRTVSDTREGDAPAEFNEFVERAVTNYVGLVQRIISTYQEKADFGQL